MFDRFKDGAGEMMNFAHEEARRLGHDYIGTEHLLLGLVRESSGLGAASLRALGVELDAIPPMVEALADHGTEDVTMGQLPFTVAAKGALERSLQEAADLGHTSIGTEHLLLGMIGQEQGIAAQVLRDLDVKLSEAQRAVLEVLRSGSVPGERSGGSHGPFTTAEDPNPTPRQRLDRMERLVYKLAEEIESLRSQLP